MTPVDDAGTTADRSISRRVMVVDDSVEVAESLGILLRKQSHEVCVLHDGPSALSRAPEFRPDVVFVDLGMPGMDGYEVARRLRQFPELQRTVLVAHTGFARDADQRQAREAGFDRHLIKPTSGEALYAVFDSLEETTSHLDPDGR
jgi:CheY-like chemotaxis protein